MNTRKNNLLALIGFAVMAAALAGLSVLGIILAFIGLLVYWRME